MKRKTSILVLILIYFPIQIFAQSVIEGTIVSINENPIAGVSIILSNPHSNNILAFGITDGKGKYRIVINSHDDSLKLKASLLGYYSKEEIILNKTSEHNYSLIQSSVTLKEVIVKNSPIRQSKDTISYTIQTFASKEDRSVSDVIRRMPGLEVQDDGKILYQGKAIQAFLVNGLDLLGGMYSLASNNLPHDAVKNVEIIENDQRIKILDSLIFSNKTTLNIQLKKYLTTGTGRIGSGASPLLWDVNLTPITFNKTFQVINSYQSNNTGKDKSMELKALIDPLSGSLNNSNLSILSLQQLTSPPYDQQFWLDNNLHLFSSNFLKVLKKDLQIKYNFSYVNDFQQKTGETKTEITLPSGTILLDEIKSNGLIKNNFKSELLLEKNTKRIYFQNALSFEKEWNNSYGNLNSGTKIDQSLKNGIVSISNKLNLITSLGKQLININSTVSLYSLPQSLNIRPGQFDSLLNNSTPYDLVIQSLRIRDLQATNYIGFVKRLNKFTLSPKFGFLIQEQNLKSSIATVNSSTRTELGNDFINNLLLYKYGFYQELNTQFKLDEFKSGLSLRVTEQQYDFKDFRSLVNNRNSQLLLEPQFNMQLKLSSQLDIFGSSEIRNTFGEITQLYNAYILQSYRTFQKLNPTFPVKINYTNGVNLNYKQPLKGFFFTVGYFISNVKSNLIFKSIIQPDGSSIIESIQKDNHQQSHTINGMISKYIGSIKTIFKFNMRISSTKSEQVINNSISNIEGNNYILSANLNNSFFKKIIFAYDGSIIFSKNKLDNVEISSIQLHQHNFKVSYLPVLGQVLSLNLKYYYNTKSIQSNRVFMNLLYRYSIPKRKLDVELACNNLFNLKYFTTSFSDGIQTIENSFKMRPRQFQFSLNFSF